MSAARRRVWRDVDAASAEGVDVTPPAGDVEQLEAADGGGQGGVYDELVTDWLKAEHGRRSSSGAPVDQAWGLQAVGYCTGYLVVSRG